MSFRSPTNHLQVKRVLDAFVDDTQNGLTDTKYREPWSLEKLISSLSEMTQTWERLLFCSGGALELTKCLYYVLHWVWHEGIPSLSTKTEIDKVGVVKLSSGVDPTQKNSHRNYSKATKTLGVWLAPNGDDSAQVKHLRSLATEVSSTLILSQLKQTEAYLAYKLCWIPTVSYSLSTTAIAQADLISIQAPATQSFLRKIWFNKHHPPAAAFGPIALGGLELRDLYIEQGIARIKSLLSHVYNSTGVMMLLLIHTLQMEAGSEKLRLTDPIPSLFYLMP